MNAEANKIGPKARWLHAVYAVSSRVHYFLHRRILPAGAMVMVAMAFAFLLALGKRSDSIYELFVFAVVFVAVALLWAMLRRARLEAHRVLPRYATVGQRLKYRVEVRNAGWRRVCHAWLMETLPDPRPGVVEFALRREPGERERNLFDRFFVYYRWRWLLLDKRVFTGGSSLAELRLEKGCENVVFMELLPRRRGVICLDDMRVALPDPLRFFQRLRRVPAPRGMVTVLPLRYPLPAVEMPGGAAQKIMGETSARQTGSAGEFVGLRDYRPGDPPRQIHWKSWARQGKPIVKELEDTFFPRFGLVLDTYAVGREAESFETAVSVAASFVHTLDRGDTLLDLMFLKGQAHVVTAGRGVDRGEKLLEVLAGVESESEADYRPLAELVLRYRDELASCLVVFVGWDAERAAFLESLTSTGLVCVPLVVGGGERVPGAPGCWVRAEHAANDLLALPTHLQATAS